MRIIFLVFMGLFLITNISEAKTLVKYNKNSGDIIQTNNVDEMPSQQILADRFKSEDTDVILVDGVVDISTQRVDLNKKKLINIPQKELSDVKKTQEDKQAAEKLINEKIREQAINTLKTEGKLDANGKIVK
jgi:hypothetical protein